MRRRKIIVYLTAEEIKELKLIAVEQDTSLARLVTRIIRDWLSNYRNKVIVR